MPVYIRRVQHHFFQQEQEKIGIVNIASGLSLILIIIFLQHVSISLLSSGSGGRIVLSESLSTTFKNAALPTFIIILVGAGLSFIGVSKVFESWKKLIDRQIATRNKENMKILDRVRILIASSFSQEKNAFWISLLAYCIVFLFSSGMAIYSAESLSARYGVGVPSYYITGCCGQPANFPVLTIYLTQHFGLLILPANLILLLFLPLLVAVNVSIIVHTARSLRFNPDNLRKGNGGREISVCGITAGMLAGCPTCAGSILFSLINGGSFSSLGLAGVTIAGYQSLFVIASLGMLLLAPVFFVLRNSRISD